MLVNRWFGPLVWIEQLSLDGIGCKTRIKFVNSHWSVLVSFDSSIASLSKSFCPLNDVITDLNLDKRSNEQ